MKKSNYLDYHIFRRKIRWSHEIQLFKTYGSGSYLDVGCAFGYLVRYASQYFHRAIGVDISVFALQEARRLHPDLEFIQCDLANLPFKDGEFDFVTALDVLEHTENLAESLASVVRVLRSGGWLYACMPYDGFLQRFLGRFDRDVTHVSVLSLQKYQSTIRDCDLSIVKRRALPTPLGGRAVYLLRKP